MRLRRRGLRHCRHRRQAASCAHPRQREERHQSQARRAKHTERVCGLIATVDARRRQYPFCSMLKRAYAGETCGTIDIGDGPHLVGIPDSIKTRCRRQRQSAPNVERARTLVATVDAGRGSCAYRSKLERPCAGDSCGIVGIDEGLRLTGSADRVKAKGLSLLGRCPADAERIRSRKSFVVNPRHSMQARPGLICRVEGGSLWCVLRTTPIQKRALPLCSAMPSQPNKALRGTYISALPGCNGGPNDDSSTALCVYEQDGQHVDDKKLNTLRRPQRCKEAQLTAYHMGRHCFHIALGHFCSNNVIWHNGKPRRKPGARVALMSAEDEPRRVSLRD